MSVAVFLRKTPKYDNVIISNFQTYTLVAISDNLLTDIK